MTFVRRTPSEPRRQEMQDTALYNIQRKIKPKPPGHKHPHVHTEYADIGHSHNDLYVSQVPMVSVRRLTDTAQFVNAIEGTIVWQAKRWDNGHLWGGSGMWDGGSSLYCKLAGIYHVWGLIHWRSITGPVNSTGQRTVHVITNSGLVLIDDHLPFAQGVSGPSHAVSRDVVLFPGDAIYMTALQQTFSGSGTENVAIRASDGWSPEFGMTWRGPIPTSP